MKLLYKIMALLQTSLFKSIQLASIKKCHFKCTRKLLLCFIFIIISNFSYGQAAAWGVAPKNWNDFYIVLVNDFKNTAAVVNETGYWVNVMDKANTTATYTASDPNKKSVLYQYKYLNPDADTTTNWYQQEIISGLHIIDHMRMDGEPLGIRNAWVIYLLQGHDGGTPEATGHIQDAAYMEKFFWNLKYVAQKSKGNKSVFIIEPDMLGYLIKSQFLGDAAIAPTMLGYAGQAGVNNPAQFGYLAGLPNTLAGIYQGIVLTIRTYAPDAYVGFHVNTWPCLDPGPAGVKPVFGCPDCIGRSGLVWRTTAEIDWTVNYQLAFYNGLFTGSNDKGDFLVMEKYGANAGSAGMTEWGWDSGAMQNWLYFSQKMGQGFCRPLISWQIQLGQTNAASAALGLSNLPNTSGRYEDTFVEYMFANFSQFLDAGFIGMMAGKGVAGATEYSLQNGYGDNGYFLKGLNMFINPGRPYNLLRGVPQPKLGNDTTLCGTGGSLVLNPGNPGTGNLINWSTGATTPTITVTTPGTYWVNVADGTVCGKSDTIVVSGTYSISLGADRVLCNPASLLLDAGHQGTGVTFVWQKNATVIASETSRYLFVNQPGTYQVTVTDPACLPAQTSQIILTANTVVPTASTFCFTTPSGSASLSVQNNGGTYDWYANATGGTSLNTGLSYSTPSISVATTYYVADSKAYSSVIMPKVTTDGFSNSANAGATNGQDVVTGTDWLYFNASVAFTLKSFKIDAIVNYCGGTRRGGLIITNTSTGFSFDSGLITFPCTGTGLQTMTVTLPGAGILIPKGNGYSVRYYTPLEAIMDVYAGGSGTPVYPKNYNNIMTTTGYNNPSSSISIFGHPGMYDWNITAAPVCDRTPVLAIPCTTLPLSWIMVSAENSGNVNYIEWSALEDAQLENYTVEKSTDGISFSSLNDGELFYAVHSIGYYKATDPSGNEKIVYYRIRAKDIDGEIYYSKIVSVFTSDAAPEIYPNPSGSSEGLYLKADPAKEFQMTISDMNGKNIYKIFTIKGDQKIPHIENLSSGIYLLEIQSQEITVYRKCIRE